MADAADDGSADDGGASVDLRPFDVPEGSLSASASEPDAFDVEWARSADVEALFGTLSIADAGDQGCLVVAGDGGAWDFEDVFHKPDADEGSGSGSEPDEGQDVNEASSSSSDSSSSDSSSSPPSPDSMTAERPELEEEQELALDAVEAAWGFSDDDEPMQGQGDGDAAMQVAWGFSLG